MAVKRRIIGVDVGGTKVAAAVLLSSPEDALALRPPEVIARRTAPTEVSSAAACLDGISACIDRLVEAAGPIDGIGIGIASLMDHEAGRATHSVHLPLSDVPLKQLFEERHGVPVAVDNDASVACLAEHAFGAGAGSRHMVMLTLGTGVGGGIICHGRLYRGAGGTAAELGHMVVNIDGPKCPGDCPNRGCLEAYVSGTALTAAARRAAARAPLSGLGRARAAGETVDSRLLVRLAEAGDRDAAGLLARRGQILGVGLASLVNIFSPEVIVVGGGVAEAGELLLGPARLEMLARALPPARERVEVLPALLGPAAGVYGAAALVLLEMDGDGGAASEAPAGPS